jgi:hypothetical protein
MFYDNNKQKLALNKEKWVEAKIKMLFFFLVSLK